jgi:hypothetical protein
MTLPCKLTEEELLAKGEELSRAIEEANGEKGLQQEAKSAMKSRLEGMENRIQSLAGIVRTRSEERLVEIITRHDDERKMVETVRVDTGEVVATRLMTPEERNLKLFPHEVEAAATEPKG